VDFLPLGFDYKEKFSTVQEQVHELHWFKRSIRGWIASRLIHWNMRIRKKIRQQGKSSFTKDNLVRKALRGESI
jgi:hypothetical protein